MFLKGLVKVAIAAGIAIWAIPFLSAAIVGLFFVGLISLKNKIAAFFAPSAIDLTSID
jgi:hypothetical protein